LKKYNYEIYGNLKSTLIFEIISFLGRSFKKRKSEILTNKIPILLDLGVGNNYKEGWLHADFYIFRFRFWRKSSKIKKPEIELDLRYPLRCPSDSVDGVYTSHTLEHLYPDDAINLLKEIYRILNPNSFLRIIVPDIELAVNFYTKKHIGLLEYDTGCEAISDFTQNWGHKSAWDFEFLSKVLNEIGFYNIKKVEFGKEGSDKRLIKETEGRRRDSLVVEAQKPLE